MAHAVAWVDIPILDLDRAIRFYEAVLGAKLHREQHGEFAFAVLPHAEDEVAGCLVPARGSKPSADGPLVYLNCEGRLEQAVAAVSEHGGKVWEPPRSIGPYGQRAIVLDSEGNRLALHSK